MKDYQAAVAAAKAMSPRQLRLAWFAPWRAGNPAGLLFHFCTPSGRACPPGPCGRPFGDPLMVAGGKYWAWTEEATAAIRAAGLPTSAEALTPEGLEALASLQLDLDLTVRDPAWLEGHRHGLRLVGGREGGEAPEEAEEAEEARGGGKKSRRRAA